MNEKWEWEDSVNPQKVPMSLFYWIDMAVPVFMIITGYLVAFNMNRQRPDKHCLSIEEIIRKLLRFLIPWLPILIAEALILLIVKHSNTYELIRIILKGGYGPGSYYTPIMIQMIFLGYIIYYIVRRFDWGGVIICFTVTGGWEAISYSINLNDGLYALIAIRYVSLFAFGCYIAIGKKTMNTAILVLIFIIGIVWQTALNYIPLQPPFMNYAWARVNLYSSLFILPIMYILIKKYHDSQIKIPFLQELGKASYDIFLVQMAFYGCGPAQLTYKFIDNSVLQFFICFISCIAIGYLYYKVESPITKKIISLVKNGFERTFKFIA